MRRAYLVSGNFRDKLKFRLVPSLGAECNVQTSTGEDVAARKRLLEQELSRYMRVLVEQDVPEKVIVFGSLTSGDLHPYSDIDLVIVKQTELPFFQRLRQMYRLLRPSVGTDILVYTPEEFADLSEHRPFVQEEIVAKGRVLYERDG